MSKVIFCDVDGVLNGDGITVERSPGGFMGVSDELILRLKKIVDRTGSEVVLSSDWRLSYLEGKPDDDYLYLAGKLSRIAGIAIAGHTKDIGWSRRGEEIADYLAGHPEITSYLVLDDIRFPDFGHFRLRKHLILTDKNTGLTEEDVEKAVRILGEKGMKDGLGGVIQRRNSGGLQ